MQGETSTLRSQSIPVRVAPNSGISGKLLKWSTRHYFLTYPVLSMDDFAWHDIPDTIDYILKVTKTPQLSYIGFSQGTAQAFAALSIHPQLNEKVNVFIGLAPAMNPEGLAVPIVDGFMKASCVITSPSCQLYMYCH